MWNGIDLIQSTQIVPFEVNPSIKLSMLTLNRNPTNIFAASNAMKGVSFVPDPLLQWRLMSCDDTSTHRHNSLDQSTKVAPINNNY
jgi:catalase